MTHADRCTAGEWVEVERVLLEPPVPIVSGGKRG